MERVYQLSFSIILIDTDMTWFASCSNIDIAWPALEATKAGHPHSVR